MPKHTFNIDSLVCEVELIESEFSQSPAEQNADFLLRLSTGPRYAGVVATIQNLTHLLAHPTSTYDSPHWLAIKGLVIVPEFTSHAIMLAIEHLVRNNAHTWALVCRFDDETD